ncbi:unnamed protein product, partial [marine sediment metagenome]
GESFIIYPESEYYIHKFDLDYSLVDDFNSTQVFKIIGLSPTFEQTVLNATENYIIEFYPSTNEIKITDGEWSGSEGRLNDFDSIAVFLNFSFGPLQIWT